MPSLPRPAAATRTLPPPCRLRNDTSVFRRLLQAANLPWLEDPAASVTILAPTDFAMQAGPQLRVPLCAAAVPKGKGVVPQRVWPACKPTHVTMLSQASHSCRAQLELGWRFVLMYRYKVLMYKVFKH